MPAVAVKFVLILSALNFVAIQAKTNETDLSSEKLIPHVCQSKDIRNVPSELMSLRGCRVIEGFLMITLIDRYNDTDYDNLTFPELVEITDFLMLYQVHGFRTLAHLFPNLSVIRGNNLFNNYALIIYEMLQLTEIGLKSLTNIVRGGVVIRNNPLLCFVDTINWAYITNGMYLDDHFIDSNKNKNECPVCPTERNIDSDIKCPVSKDDPKKGYCWNRRTCQKICPDSCGTRSCDDKGNCCDEKCLDSCEPTDSSNCNVCRQMSVGPLYNRQCIEKCPDALFMFEERHCISDIECWNISKLFPTAGDNVPIKPFIPFNGTCSMTCPKYFSPEGPNGQRYCKSCNGECKKECQGGTIYSIFEAQQYRGCSIITGTLIIQIGQCKHNVIEELEQSLSDIEEIEGALKIVRSYPLISLNFFKKLRIIRGINIQENFALYVIDNENLESLFNKPVIVERGKLFFHFNSKLCYSAIEKIKGDVYDLRGVETFDIEDVATNSNGDKVTCHVTKLTARPSSVMNIGAIIDMDAMKYDDTRVLLGYVLHYKPAPYQNVSLFASRDACRGDGWRVEYTTIFDRRDPMVQIILTNLKPFTQYAYYVKTFTIASEPYGGQTDILYFQTLPSQPSNVRNMKVLPNGPTSFIINWEPPEAANGQLTNYIVKASLIYDDPKLLQQRNYCSEPLAKVENKELVLSQMQNKQSTNIECQCPDKDVDVDNTEFIYKQKQDYAEKCIQLENEIVNMIYVKRTLVVTGEEPKERRRRTIDAVGKYSNQPQVADIFTSSQRSVEKDKPANYFMKSKMVNDSYYKEFYDKTTKADIHTFTLTKLRHFSMYSISVQACRDFNDPYFNVDTFCSNVVMLNRRTERIEDADDIEYLDYKKVSKSKNSLSMVKLNWPEPSDPNGFIVSYTIIYKRVDLDDVKPTEQCISQQLYSNLSGEIPLLQLSNGNYSVSVRATSLAGDGMPTRPKYIPSVEKLRADKVEIILLGCGFISDMALSIPRLAVVPLVAVVVSIVRYYYYFT